MTAFPQRLASIPAAAGLPAFALPAQSETLTGPGRVIDGDTLTVAGERVRLNGIDAPETRQTCTRDGRPWACGTAATQAMRQLIGQSSIHCEVSGRDKYGRAIATCFADGRDLQQQLVRRGLAFAYRKYSTRFVPDENAARAEGVGVWSGEFVEPWRWRKGHRSQQAKIHPRQGANPPSQTNSACRIKGNISGSGRIYHVPGGHYYDRTRINASAGERWFCSEAEARAAGWRRARR